MSKKYLTGGKRLQIIQRWLSGIDDPDYDVFPTKKEGRYIVKPRKNTEHNSSLEARPSHEGSELDSQTEIENDSSREKNNMECDNDDTVQENKSNIEVKETPIQTKPKQVSKQISKTNNSRSGFGQTHNQYYDPTINIEILNQLKLLGEEFKNEREKKEQKRIIKEAVQKQISKPRMQYNYTEPAYIQQPNLQQEEIQQAQNVPMAAPQPVYTRKNNIFADMM